jgi:hypothetical protein
MQKLLIGYSRYFGNERHFKEELDNLVLRPDAIEVVSVSDIRGFIREYFGDSVVQAIDKTPSRQKIKQLLSDVSHVIIFWDGTELTDYVYLSSLLKLTHRIIAVETTRPVNIDKDDDFDIYIGRRTPWGNPFAIGHDNMSRDDVIREYRKYFQKEFVNNPEKRKLIESLRGKRLGCHCKPLACHGDIIAEFLNTTEPCTELQLSQSEFKYGS